MFGNNDGKKPFQPNFTFNQNVTSNYQSGGITAHTVNLAPQDRNLTEELKIGFRNTVPAGSAVDLEVTGTNEAHRLAQQFKAFFLEEGYVLRADIGLMVSFPPVPAGLFLDPVEGGYKLVIGPNH